MYIYIYLCTHKSLINLKLNQIIREYIITRHIIKRIGCFNFQSGNNNIMRVLWMDIHNIK